MLKPRLFDGEISGIVVKDKQIKKENSNEHRS